MCSRDFTTIKWLGIHSTLLQYLLEELHNPKGTDIAFKSNTSKSSSGSQIQKFLLSSLSSSSVSRHHQNIRLGDDLPSSIILRYNRKNCLQNNDLSIIRSSVITILQKLQAMLITPIMDYSLQNCHHISYNMSVSVSCTCPQLWIKHIQKALYILTLIYGGSFKIERKMQKMQCNALVCI